jgi:4-hydroxyphenylacetate 3-monooxygenase
MTPQDLLHMGRCFDETLFQSAGNITHTPAYGNLIALGILDQTQQLNHSQEQIDNAFKYRQMIADTQRFLTYSSGSPTIGYRFRPEADDRRSLKLLRETDAGIVVTGKVGMHTSPAFAEDIYIGAGCGLDYEGHRITFVVPANEPGVTIVSRKIAARHSNRFIAPISSRYDELDGQLWLDEVFVPWERIFLLEIPAEAGDRSKPFRRRETGIGSWLYWHQSYCWLAKLEFALGTALACAEVMGLKDAPPTAEYLVDIMSDVQIARSCQRCAELDPDRNPAGYAIPGQVHVAAGAIAMQRARQRITEILRILPGSSLVVAPSDTDLASPKMKEGLEESFGGGGYSALQRSALLSMAWDLISSGLDGRESAFELHANGGTPGARQRLRRNFDDYNKLANGVLRQLSVDMPEIDIDDFRIARMPMRRQVAAPQPAETAPSSQA